MIIFGWLFIKENDPILHNCEWQKYGKLCFQNFLYNNIGNYTSLVTRDHQMHQMVKCNEF